LSLSGSFSHITAPPGSNSILLDQPPFTGNAVDVHIASIGYGYKLARDWNAQLTYRFTHRESGSSHGNSNAVVVAVKRDMTIWHDNR